MNIHKTLLAVSVSSLTLAPCFAADNALTNDDASFVRPCVVKGCMLPVYPKIESNQSVELEVSGLPNTQDFSATPALVATAH